MELSKVLDGFTVADTLVIKAQVQVIHEKPARPFRCLESQYRRELVRVYLTNVEGICRRFLEEKREGLAKMREDKVKWEGMRQFLQSTGGKQLAAMAMVKADVLLKGIVKRFFNEKEVTSTLVMDALYCGCRALDIGSTAIAEASKGFKAGRSVWLSVVQNKVSSVYTLLTLFCTTESHTERPALKPLLASAMAVDPMSSARHPQYSASMTSVDVTSFSLKNRLTMPLSRTSAFTMAIAANCFPPVLCKNCRMPSHFTLSSRIFAKPSRFSSRNRRQMPSTLVRYTRTSSRRYWLSKQRNGRAGFS